MRRTEGGRERATASEGSGEILSTCLSIFAKKKNTTTKKQQISSLWFNVDQHRVLRLIPLSCMSVKHKVTASSC